MRRFDRKALSMLCIGVSVAFAGTVSAGTFPDFGYAPPSSKYSGPLFELSQA